ncbi:DUF1643 domain-containing protein [Carnobacterium maltaromaticum]|uniref:DUF1643 domain-containing protein n=1 Tax=Carnobacterium maltaromaticum TaxID=2751 RepID=UPI00191BA3E3|nr:DUF1643 domain-containing protein [Carnobacterium maltaromaticum]CAD5903232.1 hypothetical protein CMALT394_70013 [Carnobacterium maltaromaticum]
MCQLCNSDLYKSNNGDYGVFEKYIKTVPVESNEKYRYILEMRKELEINSDNHLVVVCMNPSQANDKITDATTNEIIRTMFIMGYKGFTLFNLYPERATKPNELTTYSKDSVKRNIAEIENYLRDNPGIIEVWGAWGNLIGNKHFKNGKKRFLELVLEKNIKLFYFGNLTKKKEPPHPLNRINPKFRKIVCKKYIIIKQFIPK